MLFSRKNASRLSVFIAYFREVHTCLSCSPAPAQKGRMAQSVKALLSNQNITNSKLIAHLAEL